MDPRRLESDRTEQAGLEAALRSTACTRRARDWPSSPRREREEFADNDHPTTDRLADRHGHAHQGSSVAGSIRVPGQVAGGQPGECSQRVDETKPEWTTLARGLAPLLTSPGTRRRHLLHRPNRPVPGGYAKTSGTSMAAPHITKASPRSSKVPPRSRADHRPHAQANGHQLHAPGGARRRQGLTAGTASSTLTACYAATRCNRPSGLEYRVGGRMEEPRRRDPARRPRHPFYAAATRADQPPAHGRGLLTGVDRDGSGKYSDPELSVSARERGPLLLPARRHGLSHRPRPSQCRRHASRPPGPTTDTGREATARFRATPPSCPSRSPVRAPAKPRCPAAKPQPNPPRAAANNCPPFAVNLPADKASGRPQPRPRSREDGPGIPQFSTFFDPSPPRRFSPRPGRGAHQRASATTPSAPPARHPSATGRGPHRLHDPR